MLLASAWCETVPPRFETGADGGTRTLKPRQPDLSRPRLPISPRPQIWWRGREFAPPQHIRLIYSQLGSLVPSLSEVWCDREDLNLQGLSHSVLNTARLPISPRSQMFGSAFAKRIFTGRMDLKNWPWGRVSNPLPPAPQTGALPIELPQKKLPLNTKSSGPGSRGIGAIGGIRTHMSNLAGPSNRCVYHSATIAKMVREAGFEPAVSCVRGKRSRPD